MTELAPGTDPLQLSLAYADAEKLEARRSIYEYRPEPIEFVGWCLDHVVISAGDRVLDVGCGPGHFLWRILEGERDVTAIGLDLSPGMAAEARQKVGKHGGVTAVASAEALPAPDACFDVVLAMHMLYHVPDIELAVRELRRVLRPNGVLLVSTLARRHMAKLRQLADAVVGCGRLPRPSDRFGLENGAAYLHPVFSSVTTDRVGGDIVLDHPGPAVEFLASGRDFYEPFLDSGRSWDDVMTSVERMLTRELAKSGEIRIATEMGVFVCR